MLKRELFELIENGESSTIEFKRDNVRAENIAKEIVAFANSYGGKILLGVEDDGKISGINRADLEPWIMDTVCTRYVHPSVIPQYEEVLIDNNRKVAVIYVPMGVSKPYVVRHNDREEFFIRVGSVSRLANREQIIRISASGGMLHVETLPAPRTSLKSLDIVRLKNYFKDILEEPSLPQTDQEWESRLEDMGFMTETIDNNKACTIAGLVLFGINPRKYLKQAGLRIMVFDSHDKEYKALLDIVLDAPMVARVEVTNQQVSNVVDDGLVEKAAAALYPFIIEESGTIDKDFRRPSRHYYPWNAIRELILNALAHRDWTRNNDIEICLYNNRLEVISPGALPNSMTVEKMIGGRRTPRNTIIMEALRDYQYVDSRGMGIRTKVIPIMREFNGTKPEFEATEDYLRIILWNNGPKNELNDLNKLKNDPKKPINDLNKRVNDPKDDLKHDILTLMSKKPVITINELAISIGKSPSTVKRHMQKLRERGMISRVGSRRSGKWLIKEGITTSDR